MRHLKSKVKTITFDNGLEFTDYETIGEGLDADICFAHPYASWERGINENTNGLIRQYFPKGTDLLPNQQQRILKHYEKLILPIFYPVQLILNQ